MGTKNKLIMLTAVVLILVAIISSFYFFLLKPPSKPEIGIENVPQGWSKVQDLDVAEDSLGVQYQGTGTIEDAIAAFKAEMTKAGWSHVRDETPQEGFCFSVLKKGDYEAAIMAIATEPNKIIVSIIATRSREEPLKELELPKKDVEGEDLIDVPRFSGSIRIAYENYSESVSIEYLTSANITTATEFYATKLPANGWTLEGMTAADKKTEIYATKMERGFVTISITNSRDYDGYINIDVIFTSYH